MLPPCRLLPAESSKGRHRRPNRGSDKTTPTPQPALLFPSSTDSTKKSQKKKKNNQNVEFHHWNTARISSQRPTDFSLGLSTMKERWDEQRSLQANEWETLESPNTGFPVWSSWLVQQKEDVSQRGGVKKNRKKPSHQNSGFVSITPRSAAKPNYGHKSW